MAQPADRSESVLKRRSLRLIQCLAVSGCAAMSDAAVRVVAVPRLDRRPPGLRQSRRVGFSRVVTAIRRRRWRACVLTALYAALRPAPASSCTCTRAPRSSRIGWRTCELRVADDGPGVSTLPVAPAGTTIHRTTVRRRGHYLQGSRTSLLPAQSYLFRDWLVVSICFLAPRERISRLEELCCCCATGSGLRCTLQAFVVFVDGGGRINWVPALFRPAIGKLRTLSCLPPTMIQLPGDQIDWLRVWY